MSKYRMSDGMVVDTDRASRKWEEDCYHDGSNFISRATGSQWNHERLYRSRRGRYYIERWSQWDGSAGSAEWVSNEEACRWLMLNGHDDDMPMELRELVDELTD